MNVIQEYLNFVEERGDTLLRIISRTELFLMNSLLNEINKQMKLDLSLSQIQCLQFLCLSKGTNQKDLAHYIGVTKQAMNQIINTLEKLNLVKRIPDEVDSRKKIVKHTKKGEKLISIILKITRDTEDRFIKLLGKKQIKNLKLSLEKINEQF